MSVNHKQFSINGTRRLQGFVGQTSLSRSLPRTLMRGNTIRGHGGFMGNYIVKPIVTEGTGLGTNALNDPTVVKSSVLDTKGQIATQHPWIRRPVPTTSVKPDTTLHIQTQSQYLDFLRRKNTQDTLEKQNRVHANAHTAIPPSACCRDPALRPWMKTNYRTYTTGTPPHHIAKPDKVATQGDYVLKNIANKCTAPDYCVKTTKTQRGTPFACNNVPRRPHV